MAFQNNKIYLLKNPIVNLHFAGWTSNSYDLQRNGWDLSVDENPYDCSLRFAIRNESLGLYAISSVETYPRKAFITDPFFLERFPLHFHLQQMTDGKAKIYYHHGLSTFRPINTQPDIECIEPKSIEDFVLFRKISPESADIVIPEYNIDRLLEMALELQEPKQKEIRERIRKEKDKSNEEFQEYLNSLKNYEHEANIMMVGAN